MIFVVDDDEAVRDSLRLLLEAEGLQISDFATGAEFLRHSRPDECDCVILDVNMPHMNGFEVLQRLRKNDVRVPVIVVTSDPSPAANARALSEGARLVLEKPFGRSELLGAICRLTTR